MAEIISAEHLWRPLGGKSCLRSGMGSALLLHNLDFLLISLFSSLCLVSPFNVPMHATTSPVPPFEMLLWMRCMISDITEETDEKLLSFPHKEMYLQKPFPGFWFPPSGASLLAPQVQPSQALTRHSSQLFSLTKSGLSCYVSKVKG